MTASTMTKRTSRIRRHNRVRAKVSGTAERPRLCIYKSNTQVIAQIIDDERGVTIAAVASVAATGKTPRERAEAAAVDLAKQAKAKGITKVAFDRGGSRYIGTIAAFADAARNGGLIF